MIELVKKYLFPFCLGIIQHYVGKKIIENKLTMIHLKITLVLTTCLALLACDHPEQIKKSQKDTDLITLAIQHSERPEKDVARDKTRLPGKVLNFFDIKKGDNVAELLASGGYYTELLSHCVGEQGKVYMHNNQKFYEFQTDKSVLERLSENRLSNVVRWDKELSDLQFPENSLDKLLMILVLHDFYWMEKDVDKVLIESFKALKPGGTLGIIDHRAETGTGSTHAEDMQGLHRIDKDFVIKTVVKQGFLFDAESDALSQPKDNLNKAFFSTELKGKATDRFMLRFIKPSL